ncbi:hypothetical protein [Streptosporangium fragile]|uniref:hypothetical protein n=1 Tax=Streptosporangium fragile TaxID=46186 RepID=UPI0031EB1362
MPASSLVVGGVGGGVGGGGVNLSTLMAAVAASRSPVVAEHTAPASRSSTGAGPSRTAKIASRIFRHHELRPRRREPGRREMSVPGAMMEG